MSGLSELTWAALQARVVRLQRDLGRTKASAGRLRESAKKNKPVIQDLRAKVANRDARIAALEELLAEARSGDREERW